MGEVDVTNAAGVLSVRLPTLDPTGEAFALTPTLVDNFVATDGTPATFIADASGVYRYLYTRPFVAVRVPAP